MHKHTLITNLQFVRIGEIRTYCSALLISDTPSIFGNGRGRDRRLRGFGPDPAWPVFDLALDSTDFEQAYASSPDVFISHNGASKPLSTGAILKFNDGPTLELHADSTDRPIRFDQYEGGSELYSEIWTQLSARAREFWHAPLMPRLLW